MRTPTTEEYERECDEYVASLTAKVRDPLSKGRLPTNKAVADLLNIINMRTEGQIEDHLMLLMDAYITAAALAHKKQRRAQ